jgi:hypothetical protein
MAAQYDIIAGLDISSLSSVTQAQLMQMINQAAPLSNIGSVIYGSTTPDVANNPRFARYVWLDTSTVPPTLKLYKTSTSSWIAFTPTSESVSEAVLAPHVLALDHMFLNATADGSVANYVLVYDPEGKFITEVSKTQFFQNYVVALTQISNTGARVNEVNYLKYTSSGVKWEGIDFGNDIIAGLLAIDKIRPATVNSILYSDGITNSWKSANDSADNWLPNGSSTVGINITKLKLPTVAGTTTHSHPRINTSGAWDFGKESVFAVESTTVTTKANGLAPGGSFTLLTSVPTIPSFNGYDAGFVLNVVRQISPAGSGSRYTIFADLYVGAADAGKIIAFIAYDFDANNAFNSTAASGICNIIGPSDVGHIRIRSTLALAAAGAGSTIKFRIRMGHTNNKEMCVGKSHDDSITLGNNLHSTLTVIEHL